MFDGGVPEQIQRFIASPPPPPPLSPHQSAAERSLPFPVSFTSFNTNHQAQHMLSLDRSKIIHHHQHHHNRHHDDIKSGVATAEWIGQTDHDENNHHHHHHPWCSDEVLALLRFRSTVENWFPEFTWEHTSRKLAEVGFKRSPQECKEKFEEEERRYFNSNNNNITNYNNDVEEFYHHHGNDDDHVSSEIGDNQNKKNTSLEKRGDVQEASMEDKINNVEDDVKSSSSSSLKEKKKKKRKRKKEKRFGMLKGFCEGLVRNMIAQQEEMHKKLLEDMLKKEEEKIAKEEAWKKQEIERLNKEVEIRAQEQAMVSDRNTNIIKFISNFTDQDSSIFSREYQTLTPYDPLVSLQTKTLKAKSQKQKPSKSEDTGKRWPRDEVLALINTRRNISNMNDDSDHHKDEISMSSSSSSSRSVPLWERISKKMLEIGYKRSAKRCKEKWENINKYFRKTKDVNKKRPLDSRTCPYFHQLTALYNQPSTGTITTTRPEENRVESGDPDDVPADAGGDKSNVQFSGFDLEF